MSEAVTYIELPKNLHSGVEILHDTNVQTGPVEYRYTGLLATIMDIKEGER